MTGETRVCDRCSFVGDQRSVRVRLVTYDEPRPVEVEVRANHREGAITTRETVPGIYGAEYRCVDVAACEARVAPPAPAPEPTPTTEDLFA